jgi:ABC-type antimicrobial peptide transport system permease subunit
MVTYLRKYIQGNHLSLLLRESIEIVCASLRKHNMVSSSHQEHCLGSFLSLSRILVSIVVSQIIQFSIYNLMMDTYY